MGISTDDETPNPEQGSTAASYAELSCRTNHSFLRGASHPAELVDRAAELGYQALAVTDLDGVYGMPKAYRAARRHPKLKLIVGAELTFTNRPRITLLARDRSAYGLLCRLISAGHAGRDKADPSLDWSEFLRLLDSHPGAKGLLALPRDEPGADYAALRERFPERLYLPLARLLDGRDAARTRRALALSRELGGAPIVATNDVHYHAPERRALQDAMTAIREGVSLDQAGRRLFSNAERHLKSPAEMRGLFKDLPEAVDNTLKIAESCTFCPSELRYRYPSEWIPAGETAQGYLTKLTWEGAARRYVAEPGGIPPDVRRQLEHELKLIGELGFADYFLTIWEIVEYAREKRILCQGRGSAANSAVCYCLGITAIDPVRMKLLFERFISAERGEPPDIDVDFEHERREEVIQHIYAKYGRDRAGMVAALITYREKLSKREMLKALPENEPLALRLAEELEGFPRHLSIHSGGFTLSADALIETVPIEPARMEGRTIVQWDKDDLDAIGLLKVDVLSLGMLTAVRKALDLIPGKPLTFATIPTEDAPTYEMIKKADTIGTFQIESRAQMSMLPRLLPTTFYDLVVQVAIVRPGPIQGGMVHPFLRRRKGLEPPDVPDPRLEPILGRTLGVPIFQEQVMKIAIVMAGFTPGEADELRRAIGAWRSSGSIDRMGRKLLQGLLANGIPREWADRIFRQIQGFAEYGFPESHAASFALIAYASAYLKRHYPAQFACALVNSQPMGFYSVHTILDDAKRHGVELRPVHPDRSEWDCALEDGAIRLGWRVVHGMARAEADALVAARPFRDLTDFLSRTRLRSNVLHTLAMGDAFACFGLDQRHALWEILAYDRQPNLFSKTAGPRQLGLFQPLDAAGSIEADYRSFGLSVRGHPMQALRARFGRLPGLSSPEIRAARAGRTVEACGLIIVRQRPHTAKGVVFATLEDEHGFIDLILHKPVFEKFHEVFTTHPLLVARGRVQRDGDAVSILVGHVRSIGDASARDAMPAGHDFR
jgi:error-prone DNA polymerase